MELIQGGTPHAFISNFTYWGSAVLILHSFLHVVCLLLAGGYRPPHYLRWYGSLALFGCAYLFQVTGNLLPFDKHGVQSAAIEGGIAAGMPVLGTQVAEFLMGGGQAAFNEQTLGHWYLAHRLLLPFAFVLGAVGMFFIQYSRREVKENRLLAILPILIPVSLAIFIPGPLGSRASELDYNQYGALVSWYTWPLHGSLQAFNSIGSNLGWIGTGVIPGLFTAFLVILPFLSKRIADSGVRITFGAFMLYFLLVGIFFGGRFAPLTGTRDPIVGEEPKTTLGALPIDAALAAKGRDFFNAEGCSGCHGTDGKKAQGGPALDNTYKIHTDSEWYIAFIKDPKSKKAGSTMPGFPNMAEEKLKGIAEYLRGPH